MFTEVAPSFVDAKLVIVALVSTIEPVLCVAPKLPAVPNSLQSTLQSIAVSVAPLLTAKSKRSESPPVPEEYGTAISPPPLHVLVLLTKRASESIPTKVLLV